MSQVWLLVAGRLLEADIVVARALVHHRVMAATFSPVHRGICKWHIASPSPPDYEFT